jgi:hypothetical protein
MNKLNILKKYNSKKNLYVFIIIIVSIICFYLANNNNYEIVKLRPNKNIFVKVPLLNNNIKYVYGNDFLQKSFAISFTNNKKNYYNVKNRKDIDYSKEFIIFNFYPYLMLPKDKNMEYYIAHCLPNKSYIFGNIELAWMGSTGLYNTKETNFIVLTAVVKVDNYYVQGYVVASNKGYTREDEKKFEFLLINWVINFKTINNL